jgi:hypothetical protein
MTSYGTWPAELDTFPREFVPGMQKPPDLGFGTDTGPGKRRSGGSPYRVLRATVILDGEQKKTLDRFTGEAFGTSFWFSAREGEDRSVVCFDEMPVVRESLYQSGQERHKVEIRLKVLQESQGAASSGSGSIRPVNG